MQIAVTFRHMETDEGIKVYVKEKVERLQRYMENPREIHVVLSAEKFRHIAEITLIGNRTTLNSQGRNSDLYAAIDQMVDKIERQIRERRGRVRRKRPSSASLEGPLQEVGSVPGDKEGTEVPPSIRRRRTIAKPMSLEEAIAQLSLSKKDFFFFINSDSGQINALYRVKDGGYGWVEPQSK